MRYLSGKAFHHISLPVRVFVVWFRPMWAAVLLFIALILCPGSSLLEAGEADFSREAIRLQDNGIFLDRTGRLLRFSPGEGGERHIWVSGREIQDVVKHAFIAAEDARFYRHGGFDFLAIMRALRDNLRAGRVVSGASTISQQVVRMIYPQERSYGAKLAEILRSVQLESELSKEEILEQYLNRIPMGNNVAGVELASQVYFGKHARELTAAEAAVLAALPRAPTMLNPYGKNGPLLMQKKNAVLFRMAELGFLDEESLKNALAQEIAFREKPRFPNHAPHFIDMLLARRSPSSGPVVTTVDLGLQQETERILSSHGRRLLSRGASQAAALIIHNPTMEVIASVGSLSYSSRHGGFNNGTTAFRSAGSTVKPFLYAQALEEGFTVSSLLEDTLRKYPAAAGHYSPDNFDRREYGPVTMRLALGSSLNISAVKMLEAMEGGRFYEILRHIGLIKRTDPGPEHYGLGIVIGNMEVSLEHLATAYAVLANGGVSRPLRYLMDEEKGNAALLFSAETAYIVSDILSDASARTLTFGTINAMDLPFRMSVKTGTSTRFRDGWAIGYTPEYTVGVWVGNFDGSPTAQLSGASGAAPILKDIMMLLYRGVSPPARQKPPHVHTVTVCGISGMLPGASCSYTTRELFIRGTEPAGTCSFHDSERFYHDLPVSYAGWLSVKHLKRSVLSYRLAGFGRDLDALFQDGYSPAESSGNVRLAGSSARTAEAGGAGKAMPPGRSRAGLLAGNVFSTRECSRSRQRGAHHIPAAPRPLHDGPGRRSARQARSRCRETR